MLLRGSGCRYSEDMWQEATTLAPLSPDLVPDFGKESIERSNGSIYLLGYPTVRNYDGSWTEWSSLIGAPIDK